MPLLTEQGRKIVAEQASRHLVSEDTVTQLLIALNQGGGRQAQFSLAELGGMGQWSQGGMVMVGDMFNNGLKARVDALCNDLSHALQTSQIFAPLPMTPGLSSNDWPAELGSPASQGSQNDLRYAYFPQTRRLAIAQNGTIQVYDTADHQISGFGQAQGSGQSLTFSSQFGSLNLGDLAPVHAQGGQAATASPAHRSQPAAVPTQPDSAEPSPFATAAPLPQGAAVSDDQIFSRLERLAELHQRGVLSAAEFAAKKAELLARL
jgi:hypothetical protein